MNKIITLITLIFVFPFPILSEANVNLCENTGYTIAFFHDIDKTYREGKKDMEMLKQAIGGEYKGEPIAYELFSNERNGTLLDATKLFQQLLTEYFNHGETILEDNGETIPWELFFEITSQKLYWFNVISEKYPIAQNLYKSFHENLQAIDKENFKKFIEKFRVFEENIDSETNKIIWKDYARHSNRLQTIVTERQKVIMVSHGQGIFYLNHAYEDIMASGVYDNVNLAQSIGTVYVAPYINKIYHKLYVLNSKDWRINNISEYLQAYAHLFPLPNVTITGSDDKNMDFILTYLKKGSGGEIYISKYITTFLANLKTPDTWGNIGSFTVTLTWDGQGDVDLYIDEPDGTRVAYYNKNGGSGYLEVDNTEANGPEHYFATCLSGALQSGTYRIGANNFARANGKNATIQIATGKGGMLDSKTLPIAEECGSNCNIINFFNLNVSKTQDGNANITVK